MRVILDECLPRVFADDLPGHDIQTVQQAGFHGTQNGELLKLIDAAGFNAFITVDKNMPAEQRIVGLSFGLVILRAKSNRPRDLRPLARKVLDALTGLKPGRLVSSPGAANNAGRAPSACVNSTSVPQGSSPGDGPRRPAHARNSAVRDSEPGRPGDRRFRLAGNHPGPGQPFR